MNVTLVKLEQSWQCLHPNSSWYVYFWEPSQSIFLPLSPCSEWLCQPNNASPPSNDPCSHTRIQEALAPLVFLVNLTVFPHWAVRIFAKSKINKWTTKCQNVCIGLWPHTVVKCKNFSRAVKILKMCTLLMWERGLGVGALKEQRIYDLRAILNSLCYARVVVLCIVTWTSVGSEVEESSEDHLHSAPSPGPEKFNRSSRQ